MYTKRFLTVSEHIPRILVLHVNFLAKQSLSPFGEHTCDGGVIEYFQLQE